MTLMLRIVSSDGALDRGRDNGRGAAAGARGSRGDAAAKVRSADVAAAASAAFLPR